MFSGSAHPSRRNRVQMMPACTVPLSASLSETWEESHSAPPHPISSHPSRPLNNSHGAPCVIQEPTANRHPAKIPTPPSRSEYRQHTSQKTTTMLSLEQTQPPGLACPAHRPPTSPDLQRRERFTSQDQKPSNPSIFSFLVTT